VTVSTDFPILHRYATPEDQPLIYSSWLKSYKQSPVNKRIRSQQYFDHQKKVITRLLERSHVVVVCNPDDPDQVYSFAVVEIEPDRMVIHWLSTKYTFRHLGFARSLIEAGLAQVPSLKMYVSHIPAGKFHDHLITKYNAIYDPSLKE
jgi:hypothetical protein